MFSITKLLVFGIVLWGIYIIFFKKKKNLENSETMLECSNCGVFVSAQESIVKNGKFYCSKECAK